MDVVLGQFDGVTTMRPLPLAAGLLVASARRQPALADTCFRILTQRLEPEAQAARIGTPAVLGLSLYAWNERYALAVAAAVRRASPRTLVVVGGPSVPRRPDALEAFMAAHEAVDAAVLGEGELSFTELLLAVQAGATRAALARDAIAGTVLRHGGAASSLIWGPQRERLSGDGFAATGSPYLDGTFDTFIDSGEAGPAQGLSCVFETNRGCPFACTFCDWGQATQSRVNELPLERVMAELRWAAQRRFPYFYLIDANFGIRRRDTEIVAGMAALHAETGCPAYVHFHLTKNATERNLGNVLALRRAGIATQVALSMQDIDTRVLRAIRRDNIRPERAFALREASHHEGLPTSNELLLGLPEQTGASVRSGIVAALTPFPADSFFLYPTRLLPNAELDAPEQHQRHGLVTACVPVLPADPDEPHPEPEFERVVVGTRTLPPAQWREAFVFAHALAALHNQRLAPCTLHVLVWHLRRDAAGFVDALLAAWPPWRQLLGEFADALAGGRAGGLAGAAGAVPTQARPHRGRRRAGAAGARHVLCGTARSRARLGRRRRRRSHLDRGRSGVRHRGAGPQR